MFGRRARKRMSGAANDSTTKFPISGKTMSPPILVDPALATVLGGVSRPSNVRASDMIKSQWVLLLRQPAHPCPPLLPI
ncbi:hypothetical protein V6N13_029637 [Hibiscus sabdariffa]